MSTFSPYLVRVRFPTANIFALPLTCGSEAPIIRGGISERDQGAVHATPTQRVQELRGSDRSGDRARTDRRGGSQWLRQIEPSGGAALGDGRDPPLGGARRRHGGRDLRRRSHPQRPQLRRSHAPDRQFGPAGAADAERPRPGGGRPPDHPRCRLRLQGQRQGCARPRHPDAVCRCLDRGDLARAGAPGPDQRADQRQAQEPPPRAGGSRRDFRPLPAPPRGRAEAPLDRAEPGTRR